MANIHLFRRPDIDELTWYADEVPDRKVPIVRDFILHVCSVKGCFQYKEGNYEMCSYHRRRLSNYSGSIGDNRHV